MNKLYTLMLLVLVLASCSKDPAVNPAPDQPLQSVTSYITFYKDGQLDHAPGRVKWSSELYDYDGLVSKREFSEDQVVYVSDGTYVRLTKEMNTYDKSTLQIRTLISPRTNTTKYTYTYANGRLSERKEYANSGELYKIYTYEYNDGALPLRMLEYYPDQSSPYATYTYTYDSKGNITKQHRIYFNGVEHTIDRVYDEKGNLTRETLDAPGLAEPRVIKQSKYTYDAKGRVTEKEFYTGQYPKFQKWVYSYNDDTINHPNVGKLKSIEVLVANAPNVYEPRALITYEYEYLRK